MKTCYEAIGAGGGKYTALNPFPMPFHTRNDVKPHWIFILTMFGQPINVKGPFKRPRPRQKDVEFEAEWFKRAQRLLDQGLIRTHPVRVMKGGIEKVTEGINEVRLGRVSGEKLVYRT
jgi:aspyridone synthetase trans-acting enoyl reductase